MGRRRESRALASQTEPATSTTRGCTCVYELCWLQTMTSEGYHRESRLILCPCEASLIGHTLFRR